MRTKKYILLIIILVAAVLRLWKLGSIPPHLTPDEAALGYNAYSILKTGRDEYGELLPIIFKSFGDFKPGLYVYFTAPLIAILGLNEWSVRLPSAIAGVFAVWLLYKIVLLFSEVLNNESRITNHESLATIAALLLSISPWHIHFSRGAWEANLSLTLTLAGIYFFLKSLKNSAFLIYSSLFFASTLLTYQGAKLSTLIVLFILAIIFWNDIRKFLSTKTVLIRSIIVGLIVTSPILFSLVQGKVGRLEIFSVFSYPRPTDYLQTFLDQGNEKIGSLTYYLFHPETLNFTRGIIGRWFNHFSGRLLFFEGDWQNPRHSAPNHGMLLLSDLVLLTFGLVALLKTKEVKFKVFVFLWLVLAPLPAVLSRDQVQTVRSLSLIIPLVSISAFGLVFLFERIRRMPVRLIRVSGYFLFSVVFLGNLTYYFDAYFIHLPRHDSKLWEYGYKQIVETITPIQSNYKTIKVQQSFAQPYIYFLFFQKYDPAKYQANSKLVESEYKGDVGYVLNLDNIEFTGIDWSVNRGDSGSLIIGDSLRIPPQDSNDPKLFKIIKEIKYLDGTDAFRIIEVR